MSRYNLPQNLPISYLVYVEGQGEHGAYWHSNFGTPVSHGCINLPVNNAQWLFDWSQVGTSVIIHE